MLATALMPACAEKSPSVAGDAPAGAVSADAERAAQIYSGNCAPCHQQNAQGIPGIYLSLHNSPVVLGDPAELARWVIQGQRPAAMPSGRFPTQMLKFGWMKDADAAALFTYLRAHFGNAAPPVLAGTVAKALGR